MRKLLSICFVLFNLFITYGQSPSGLTPASKAPSWDKDTISVQTPMEAATLRKKISIYLFGDSTEAVNPRIQYRENVDLAAEVPGEYTSLQFLRSADKLTIPLKHGFRSVVYVLHPVKSNGSNIPVIYHSGHNIVFFHEDRHVNDSGGCAVSVLETLLGKGFDVIGISMPMVGYNKHPDTVRENGRVIPMYRHDDIFQLRHPFYYFLEPVRATVNYLSAKKGYSRFIMMGLSGGGWTTTLYSAIDTRIWLSFPVAGSIPVPLRTNNKDLGDKEQYDPRFFHRFNYSTLYTLAADGPGRLTCQILNQKDDCCFAFNGEDYWAPNVRERLAEMDEPGQYVFYADTCAPFHKVSAAAVQKICAEIDKAFKREGLAL